jgi:hypothetical protein
MRPNQIAAVAKVGLGVYRMGSGTMLLYGRGLGTRIFKEFDVSESARKQLGAHSVRKGLEDLRDGLRQFFS